MTHITSDQPLSARTASGFAWLFVQTVGSRVVTVGAQLVLAWFVSEAAFGLIGLANTAMAVTQLVQHIGLREVLIQRSRKIRVWVDHAQHVAILVGGLASLALALSAPLVARVYDEPGVVGVLWVLAVAPVFRSLTNVAQAVLRASMRFRLVAVIELIDTLMLSVIAIPLAMLGLEEYALAIPMSAAAVVQVVVSSRFARVRPRLPIRPRRWGMLLRSGGLLAVSRVFVMVVQQIDYVLLGLFHPVAVVGLYYFAFRLSSQSVRVLNANVVGVLLPALSVIASDQSRALAALLRSLRAIAVLGVPLAMLQIALVEPVFATLFPKKWLGLGPLVQLLSVGMLFTVIGNTSQSLLMAQRRYWAVLWLTAAHATLAAAVVYPAAKLGGAFEVAVAVMGFRCIMAPVWIYVAIRPSGGTAFEVAGVFAGPLTAGTIGALLGGWAGWAVSGEWALSTWTGALVTTALFMPVYAAGVWVLCPRISRELTTHGLTLVRRLRRRRPAGDAAERAENS